MMKLRVPCRTFFSLVHFLLLLVIVVVEQGSDFLFVSSFQIINCGNKMTKFSFSTTTATTTTATSFRNLQKNQSPNTLLYSSRTSSGADTEDATLLSSSSFGSSSTMDDSNNNNKISEHPLGPPEALNSMQTVPRQHSSSGASSSSSSSSTTATTTSFNSFRYDAFGNVQNFEVTRVSDIPDMFHIKNFVSTMERHTLLWTDRNHPTDAFDYDKVDTKGYNRTDCRVSWMNANAANGIPATLAKSAAKLLFSNDMKNGKGGSGLYEPLQFVRYNENGEFLLHHDSHGRVLTVIYYLNGVAGTWFPLAGQQGQQQQQQQQTTTNQDKRNNNNSHHHDVQPQTKEEALEQIEKYGLIPGKDGILIIGGQDADKYDYLSNNHNNNDNDSESSSSSPLPSPVVKVLPGDAVAFYNYDTERPASSSAQIDWRAIHAGMPASEEKYISTHWFHGGQLTQ